MTAKEIAIDEAKGKEMNTHDKIDRDEFEAVFFKGCDPNKEFALRRRKDGVYDRHETDIAWRAWQAAIEADRQRRTPPNEPFAIVVDRMYEGEGPSLAFWNGENYQFSDGDCYDREGDTLDGYTAEFLTDHQLEKRLFDDRQRRGEPVAYFQNINSHRPGVNPFYEQIDRRYKDNEDVIPLYASPQPTNPVVKDSLTVAEPVKVPSDAEVMAAVVDYGVVSSRTNVTTTELEMRLQDIRALLARYGQPCPHCTPVDGKHGPLVQQAWHAGWDAAQDARESGNG